MGIFRVSNSYPVAPSFFLSRFVTTIFAEVYKFTTLVFYVIFSVLRSLDKFKDRGLKQEGNIIFSRR